MRACIREVSIRYHDHERMIGVEAIAYFPEISQ